MHYNDTEKERKLWEKFILWRYKFKNNNITNIALLYIIGYSIIR